MEGYGPVPNQRTRSGRNVQLASGKSVWLASGSFVKCVRKTYMPKDHPFGDYNETLYVAAYTQFGMALLENCDLDWSVY